MRVIWSLALFAAVAALSGCATPGGAGGHESPASVEEIKQPGGDVGSLLAYFEYVKKLPEGELAREHDGARQAYTRTRSDYSRVRLAMVLSLPNTAFGDQARALEILEPAARNPDGALHGLAVLLSAYIQEQKRLAGSVQELQHNVQGLQQKLDALKSLERSLSERGQGGEALKKR